MPAALVSSGKPARSPSSTSKPDSSHTVAGPRRPVHARLIALTCSGWHFRDRPSPASPVTPLREILGDQTIGDPLKTRERVGRFWRSERLFMDGGLGYCAIEDGRIVSICISGYVDGTVHTVEIETEAGCRQRGLGLAVARAFVAGCLQRGFLVHWDCMQSNTASRNLAERLGLVRADEYRCYYFKL